MTIIIIITFCILLLLAYIFDITSSKTKIPSVILLLFLGWSVRQGTIFFDFQFPDLTSILPIIGTLGLILIVLEGSLELEINKQKLKVIRKSLLGALFPMIALAITIAMLFSFLGNKGIRESLINAIPFCVISSAIAIPSVKNLSNNNREFIIYESSLSDIFGILIFNFLVLNDFINLQSLGLFALQFVIIFFISALSIIGLSFLLNKIEHHVKFIPIIIIVILIYAISKLYHLPALLFILIFGLFIGNIDALKHLKWIERFKPNELKNEVRKFKELTIESAFLVRVLFFLLFGYLIETNEILNQQTIYWAITIVALIFIYRAIQLKISKLPLTPLLFISPRGLITILLFLSIGASQQISLVNKSLIIQVIILSALVMMVGLMAKKQVG